MISSISIAGFKCFKTIERLPLTRLNVLVGGNAAGKSTLIQTLLLLRQSADRDGRIREIRLAGELYTAGTAKEVVRLDADRKMRFILEEEGKVAVDVLATYDSGTNPRTLRLARDTSAGPLAYQPTVEPFVYLSAERIGPKVRYPIIADNNLAGPVGKHGEMAASFITRVKSEDTRVHDGWTDALPVIHEHIAAAGIFGSPPDVTAYTLAAALQNWITPGISFDANEDADSDQSRLTFNNYRRDPLANVRPTNIGFGLTQVLPIISGIVAISRGGLYLLENPEAHLHPLGQSRIGSALALSAGTGIQVVLETHSDHVVNGIRLAVKRKWIDSDDVMFYYFNKPPDENLASITPLKLNKDGRLSDWPVGFFDQIEKDLAEL